MKQPELYNPLTRRAQPILRILGEYSQGRPGPLLVVIAGIHGNEPSGVFAATVVLESLQQQDADFHGSVVAIAGNLPALAADQRFLDEDLNRIWQSERIDQLRAGRAPASTEERELLALLEVIESRVASSADERYFLDCHSTSSASLPYISVPDDPASIEWARQFPVMTVIGAGDAIGGTSDRYLIDRGFQGLTFEAGRHHSLAAIEAQEAAIWLALHRAGCIKDCPSEMSELLSCSLIDGPQYFRLEYIHRVTPQSEFRMRPGYCNFQAVRKGELLAWEGAKEIESRWNARIFLPLYQSSGDDGFSIIRELESVGPELED